MGFNKKIAMGIWINDVRNSALPNSNWPDVTIDEELINDYKNLFINLKAFGFNAITIFGLLAGHDWPPDLNEVFKNNRRKKVQKIIDMAHEYSIDVIFGMGVYSWGFDEIIRHDPRVRGTNPSAMCGAKIESRQWQEKVNELVATNFDIDGFHLEASDQGRCMCEDCSTESDVQYYSRLNKESAIFIRERWPDKYLLVNDCAYMPWGDFVDRKEFNFIVDLSKHIDVFIDNGNHGLFIREEDRKEFLPDLKCSFGSSGGFWIYPPQRWDRLRWFLPYTKRTGNFLKRLSLDGGTACQYYVGPLKNPSTEINTCFGGYLLSNIDEDIETAMSYVIESLYKPKNKNYLDGLVEIFINSEDAFFNNWIPNTEPLKLPEEFAADVATLANWTKRTPERTVPGELFLEPLVGIEPGYPTYLKNNMNLEGLKNYKNRLEEILNKTEKIKDGFNDKQRVLNIITCIQNTIKDIDLVAGN